MSDTELIIDQATGEVKETRKAARKAAESAAEFTKAFEKEFSDLTKAGEEDPSNQSLTVSEQYTIGYALAQLERIRVESARFSDEVRRSAENVKSGGPGDVGAAAAGNALMALVKGQQETYRKLIDFYAGMIAELKAEKREAQKDQKSQNDLKRMFLDFVADCAPRVQAGAFQPDYQAIWDIMNK